MSVRILVRTFTLQQIGDTQRTKFYKCEKNLEKAKWDGKNLYSQGLNGTRKAAYQFSFPWRFLCRGLLITKQAHEHVPGIGGKCMKGGKVSQPRHSAVVKQVRWLLCFAGFNNVHSAGSPTETSLWLRLHLKSNDHSAGSPIETSLLLLLPLVCNVVGAVHVAATYYSSFPFMNPLSLKKMFKN